MNNADTLRKLSFAAMIVAITAGLVSLYMLFASPVRDMTAALISVIALVIGLGIDRRVRKMDIDDAR